MISLRCLRCGVTVPLEGSRTDLCQRCLVRDGQRVRMIPVSDRPANAGAAGADSLAIRAESHEGRAVVSLAGELDVASAADLEAVIVRVCREDTTELVLDMTSVEFIDSSGLNAILRAKMLCVRRGCSFLMTPAQEPAQRTLRTMGVDDRLSHRRAGQ
jgi:anti-sigma B factor antagonist